MMLVPFTHRMKIKEGGGVESPARSASLPPTDVVRNIKQF